MVSNIHRSNGMALVSEQPISTLSPTYEIVKSEKRPEQLVSAPAASAPTYEIVKCRKCPEPDSWTVRLHLDNSFVMTQDELKTSYDGMIFCMMHTSDGHKISVIPAPILDDSLRKWTILISFANLYQISKDSRFSPSSSVDVTPADTTAVDPEVLTVLTPVDFTPSVTLGDVNPTPSTPRVDKDEMVPLLVACEYVVERMTLTRMRCLFPLTFLLEESCEAFMTESISYIKSEIMVRARSRFMEFYSNRQVRVVSMPGVISAYVGCPDEGLFDMVGRPYSYSRSGSKKDMTPEQMMDEFDQRYRKLARYKLSCIMSEILSPNGEYEADTLVELIRKYNIKLTPKEIAAILTNPDNMTRFHELRHLLESYVSIPSCKLPMINAIFSPNFSVATTAGRTNMNIDSYLRTIEYSSYPMTFNRTSGESPTSSDEPATETFGDVSEESCFIFPFDDHMIFNRPMMSAAEQDLVLNEMIGGYLFDLDMSKSYITGSMAAATMSFCTQHETHDVQNFAQHYYPSVHTKRVTEPEYNEWGYLKKKDVPAPSVASVLPMPFIFNSNSVNTEVDTTPKEGAFGMPLETCNLLNFINAGITSNRCVIQGNKLYLYVKYSAEHDTGERIISMVHNNDVGGTVYLDTKERAKDRFGNIIPNIQPYYRSSLFERFTEEKKENVYEYSLSPGADVDIAVDVETNEELEKVAKSHYNVILNYWPNVKLEILFRPSGNDMYEIKSENIIDYINGFRSVQIYKSNPSKIITHHVPPVRAWRGSRSGIYASISAIRSIKTRNMNMYDFNYVAGVKRPLDTVVKYMNRGFTTHALDGSFIVHDRKRELKLESFNIFAYLRRCVTHAEENVGLRLPGTNSTIRELHIRNMYEVLKQKMKYPVCSIVHGFKKYWEDEEVTDLNKNLNEVVAKIESINMCHEIGSMKREQHELDKIQKDIMKKKVENDKVCTLHDTSPCNVTLIDRTIYHLSDNMITNMCGYIGTKGHHLSMDISSGIFFPENENREDIDKMTVLRVRLRLEGIRSIGINVDDLEEFLTKHGPVDEPEPEEPPVPLALPGLLEYGLQTPFPFPPAGIQRYPPSGYPLPPEDLDDNEECYDEDEEIKDE